MLIFYFFAVIQIYFGYLSVRGGIDYLKYFKDEIGRTKTGFAPLASVIVPCRGIDPDLERNLDAIFTQDYPDYEIIFVVDSGQDESVEVIEKIIGAHGRGTLVIAGAASDSGQKVHNLRAAVLKAADRSEVLVFVDSDACPAKSWLKNLVGPLANDGTGCTTGYRWFIQQNGGFSTQLRAAWNASIASSLGRNRKTNFCWGGSTAIKREVFEKLRIREEWKSVVSDDFVLTDSVRRAGLFIHFVPQCLTATIGDCGFLDLLEFTTRQMKITRVYSPNLWILSFISAIQFVGVFWGGMALLFLTSGMHFWLTLSLLAVILILGIWKTRVRLEAVMLVLAGYERELARQRKWQSLLWLISPVLFLYNDLIALSSRRIVWRGIGYELESSRKTNVVETDG